MTIFIDLDGTIINSFERHYRLLQYLLAKHEIKKKIDKELYFELKRNGINNYEYLTKHLLIKDDIAILIQKEWIRNIENKIWLKFDALYNDALIFLDNIKDNTVFYLTARKNEEAIRSQVTCFGIDKFVKEIYVVDPSDPINNKYEIINQYRIDHGKEKVAIIGDTEVEFLAANKAKTMCYILNRGFRSKEFLLKKNIKKTYCDLDEIWMEVKNDKC